MTFLRKEFENNEFVRRAGDEKDFYEWLGADPTNLFHLELEGLPVFDRLGIDVSINKTKGNKKNQATVFVRKGSTFLSVYLRLSGKRTYSQRAAVLSALLTLWELETLRKVQAVKEAFGVSGTVTVTYPPSFQDGQDGFYWRHA